MTAKKSLLCICVGAIVFCVVASGSLWYYDLRTKQNWLLVVAHELPPGSSANQMVYFMQRHTARYAVGEGRNLEYRGFVPQARSDKFLLDRRVQLVLRMSENHTFLSADVRVYYTGL
jgi:hypothetical protein